MYIVNLYCSRTNLANARTRNFACYRYFPSKNMKFSKDLLLRLLVLLNYLFVFIPGKLSICVVSRAPIDLLAAPVCVEEQFYCTCVICSISGIID